MAASCRATVLRSLPAAKRSCQRHTQVLDLPVCRMISTVPAAVDAQQDDLGAPDVLLWRIAVFDESHQSLAIGRRNGEGYSCAHAPDSHALSPKRIPSRTLMLGRYH